MWAARTTIDMHAFGYNGGLPGCKACPAGGGDCPLLAEAKATAHMALAGEWR